MSILNGRWCKSMVSFGKTKQKSSSSQFDRAPNGMRIHAPPIRSHLDIRLNCCVFFILFFVRSVLVLICLNFVVRSYSSKDFFVEQIKFIFISNEKKTQIKNHLFNKIWIRTKVQSKTRKTSKFQQDIEFQWRKAKRCVFSIQYSVFIIMYNY